MASNNSFQHMKKSSFLVLIVLVFVDFAPAQIPETSNLRIMTYNIWNGFDWGKDSIRKESTIEWIKSQKPDVLALQELCNYTEEKLKEDPFWHGLLHCESYGIDFYIVHLSPADCDIRLDEARLVTERIKKNFNTSYIILGDFNSLSPLDVYWMENNTDLKNRIELHQAYTFPTPALTGKFSTRKKHICYQTIIQ